MFTALVDLERATDVSPNHITATVPTDLQRTGDFSKTFTYDANGNPVLQQIFNPFSLDSSGNRAAFQGNVIPKTMLDPIALNIMKLYPKPNLPGDPVSGTNNYRANVPGTSEGYQYDVKLDYQWNDKHHTSGRYSMSHNISQTPTVFGDGSFGDGTWYLTDARNAVVEHDWTLSPRILITSRLGVDRAYGPGKSNHYPDPTKLGFPPILDNANGIVRMPTIDMDTP